MRYLLGLRISPKLSGWQTQSIKDTGTCMHTLLCVHPLGQHHCKILPHSPRLLCLQWGCTSEFAYIHTESLLTAPQKELSTSGPTGQNTSVPQVPVCCCSGFAASEKQAGWAVSLPHHLYCKGKNLSLAVSTHPWNRALLFLYQHLCNEGPETW